jgi:hypothetical protein
VKLTDTELADFAAKVASELGMWLDDDWTSHGANITDGTLTFHLGQPYRVPESMVQVSGVFPNSNYGFKVGQRDHIQATIGRGPHAVAAEIARRLRPAYRQALADMAAYDAEEAAAQAARDALGARLAAQVGGRVDAPSHMQDAYRSELLVRGPDSLGGAVKFHGTGAEVEFDRFRVPAEVAVAMLAVYGAWLRSRGSL